MRSALLAVALMVSGAAIAQDYTTPQPDPNMPADVTTTDMTTDTSLTTTAAPAIPSTGSVQMPSNANPEHDARGIAVISAEAFVPAGWNGTTATGMGGPLADPGATPAPQAASESYPACSRTITDNCLQTYERGRSPE